MSMDFAWHPQAWWLVAPMLAVVGTSLVVLMAGLASSRHAWTWLSCSGLVVAAVLVVMRWNAPLAEAEAALNGALRADRFAVFLQLAVLACAALSLLATQSYSERDVARKGEFHALVLLSTAGMLVLVASGDFITMFLGLELLSFPTYVLCGFLRHHVKANEAALKYFVLGSFASSIFLYGVALLWGATGSVRFEDLAAAPDSGLFQLGALFVVIGFLFKVGAAPFHMWVPDVYEGAPTPVTMFMATAVKIAAFGAFQRALIVGLLRDAVPFESIFWWLACATMFVGNLSALTQDNVKRLLAFSSVAHAGYMLVGVSAVAATGNLSGAAAVLYYLLAYAFMNIGALTVVTLLQRRAEGELQFDRDWSGVARRHPVLGMAMAVFMIALGGLPPTAGFFGKYSLFRSAIDAGLVGLVIVAVLNSAISVYYYLRVLVAMYMKPEREPTPSVLDAWTAERQHAFEGPGAMAAEPAPEVPPRVIETGAWPARLVVLVCVLATLWLGMGPALGAFPGLSRVMEWAELAVAALR